MEYNIMNDGKDKNMKLEITQDKLVDLLMHSATRQDIAELRNEMQSDKNELKAEIAQTNNRIDNLRTELKSDIAEVKTELKADMKVIVEKVDNNFKWLAGILVVGLLIPIILQFVK
jgi:uncharacterized protein YpmS